MGAHPNDTEATKNLEEKIAESTQSLEFSHFVGVSFWVVYHCTRALLASSSSMSFVYAQFLPTRAALPPPFHWFYYLACLARWVKKKSKKQTVQSKNPLGKTEILQSVDKISQNKNAARYRRIN